MKKCREVVQKRKSFCIPYDTVWGLTLQNSSNVAIVEKKCREVVQKTKVVLHTLRHFWRVNIKKLEEYCYVCLKVLLGSPRSRQGLPKGSKWSFGKALGGFGKAMGRRWEGFGRRWEGFGKLLGQVSEVRERAQAQRGTTHPYISKTKREFALANSRSTALATPYYYNTRIL